MVAQPSAETFAQGKYSTVQLEVLSIQVRRKAGDVVRVVGRTHSKPKDKETYGSCVIICGMTVFVVLWVRLERWGCETEQEETSVNGTDEQLDGLGYCIPECIEGAIS